MTELLSKMESLLLADYMDINISERPDVTNDETSLPFQPRIYPSSSVIRDTSGDVAMELFNHILLPRDKTMFLNRAHPWVEKHAAELLSKLSLCIHQLALTCSFFKNDGAEVEKKLIEYKKTVEAEMLGILGEREKFSETRIELEETKTKLAVEKGKVNELQLKLLEAINQSESARSSLAEEVRRTRETATRDAVKMYLVSAQFKADLQKNAMEARQKAIKDFLKSEEMERFLLKNAMNDHYDGFFKAIDHMKQLKFQPPISFGEFEANYKTRELLRPSLAIEGPPNLVSYPEFKTIIESVEEEVRKWREGLGSPEFMEDLEATVDRRNEGGVVDAHGSDIVALINFDNIDEAGTNLNMELPGVRANAVVDDAAMADA